MTSIDVTDPKVVLSHLLSSWRGAAASVNHRPVASSQDAVVQARLLLAHSLDRFRPFMSMSDATLYQRLLDAREPRELGALYFVCFDLLARTRGIAVAVLGMQDLYRVLRPFTDPCMLPGVNTATHDTH